MTKKKYAYPILAVLAGLTMTTQSAKAQQAPAPKEEAQTEEAIVLSPFTVNTEKDKGYKATNAVSGTRLSTTIKDVPLPIEVITNEFMRDIGATNLREALSYSAGILLESQNDALVPPYDLNNAPGSSGANDPRGATRAATNTTTKIRGFVVDQTLREGFRRQFSTDWINVERVEVVRGPQALLYGVGSFGGVVNYVTKKPTSKASSYASFSAGTNSLLRAEFDQNTPLSKGPSQMGLRVTGAWQQNGDYTQWYHNQQSFISAVFSFKPFKNTKVVFDNEFGKQHETGTGFQNLRQGSGIFQQFMTDASIDARTFRWSGPDTYVKKSARNHVLDVEQKLAENFYIKAGADFSHSKVEGRGINAGLADSATAFNKTQPIDYYEGSLVSLGGKSYDLRTALTTPPTGYTQTDVINAAPAAAWRYNNVSVLRANYSLTDQYNSENDPNYIAMKTPTYQTIAYTWQDRTQTDNRQQYRAEATYMFEWFGKHNILAGVQYQKAKLETKGRGAKRNYTGKTFQRNEMTNYHKPNDYGVFRFGTQGDGYPDVPMVDLDYGKTTTWDLGYYAVYQGRFWKDRITAIAGYRRDRDDSVIYTKALDSGVETLNGMFNYGLPAPTKGSPQYGLSFQVTKSLSVFADYSTGLIPNYTQQYGDGTLRPTTAKSKEVGIKFDLFHGRLSGTIAGYKIERNDTPRGIWFSPAPYKNATSNYDPAKPMATIWANMSPEPLWYAINNTTNGLAIAKQMFPKGWWGMFDKMAATPASATSKFKPDYTNANWGGWGQYGTPGDAWNGSGLWGKSNSNTMAPGDTSDVYWPLVNMGNATFQQFCLNAFNYCSVDQGNSWGGNFYGQANATPLRQGDGTIGIQNIPAGNGAAVPINDESKGWDAQIIFTPVDEWQIILNYAHVNRRITSKTFAYAKAPYWPFAMWYYPTKGWGTITGVQPKDAYYDVTDSSTFHIPIVESGESLDDTPKNQWSVWNHYRFDRIEKLKGLGIGVGGQWVGPRQWFSGVNSDGTSIMGSNNKLVQFYTKTQFTLNLGLDYNFKLAEKYNCRLAMNINNLLDDQKRYGWVYTSGRSARISAGINF